MILKNVEGKETVETGVVKKFLNDVGMGVA